MVMRIVLIVSLLIFYLATKAINWTVRYSVPKVPTLTLWAWDKDEDLSFVNPGFVSVAYYAGTIYLKNHCAFFKPRLHKLKLAASTRAYPVFRIENISTFKSTGQTSPEVIVNIIKQYQSDHRVRSIQIDYDASESERGFYLSLLQRLRRSLPKGTHISITVLVSWCLDDCWLQRVEADEAVVMLFSTGWSPKQIMSLLALRKLDTGGKIDLCLGISANEQLTNACLKKQAMFKNARQLYIFNSLPWTRLRFETIIHEVLDQ